MLVKRHSLCPWRLQDHKLAPVARMRVPAMVQVRDHRQAGTLNVWHAHKHIFLSRDYAAVHVLPSYLKRRRGDAVDGNKKNKKTKVIKQWDRDVVCLPPKKSDGVVSFSRGGYRTYLANCGLIGKLHMTSDMDEEDVAREVRSIFQGPMKGKADFHFQYLQATGGGTKSLTVPAQSESFKWTPFQVSRLSGQSGTIYILAKDELDLNDKVAITYCVILCSVTVYAHVLCLCMRYPVAILCVGIFFGNYFICLVIC